MWHHKLMDNMLQIVLNGALSNVPVVKEEVLP